MTSEDLKVAQLQKTLDEANAKIVDLQAEIKDMQDVYIIHTRLLAEKNKILDYKQQIIDNLYYAISSLYPNDNP